MFEFHYQTEFTFHYVSILMGISKDDIFNAYTFTFHYVSILM